MCGINGFISERYSDTDRQNVVRCMNATIAHRGPDAEGLFDQHQTTLGHRRLSIIDLSEACNQPFYSADRRYVIVYNGELYNYKDLKLELQRAPHGSGHKPYFFRTNSDTEVVLASFIRWGHKCLDYFNGMFAFAIYDAEQRSTLIARDRLGVKPLYYYYGDEGFIFSSEIRPILKSGVRPFSLNPSAVSEYVRYQTVHAPNTIVKGIKVLLPGHFISFENDKPVVSKYYELNHIRSDAHEMSYPQICDKVNELLSHSVQRRLVADVPFGAFLSGGIDSSAVVGLMTKVSSQKVRTFNVSFDESAFSESRYARLISKKFDTEHNEIVLKPDDFLHQLPEALAAMDHPSGDGPNTYIVSKATKNAGITMALSGIGGDELFAGYDVFRHMTELEKRSWLNAFPRFARSVAGKMIKAKKKSVGGNKIAELLAQPKIDFRTAFPLVRTVFTTGEIMELVNNPSDESAVAAIISRVPQIEDHLLSAVSLAEIQTYLQNVLLRDTDQMSMAVALEVREPFLDHHLVEFVLGVPDIHKYPHTPKKLLVDALGDLLPPEIVNRPKMGFTLPWERWLRNELQDFAQSNITELSRRDQFVTAGVNDLWKRFAAGDERVKWSRIWHLVTLNDWITKNNLSA